MRIALFAAIIMAFCAIAARSEKPKTVDEAVQIIKTKWMKPKDLDWILRNPKDQVVWTLYRPFGTGVRNQFGLWGDNVALHESCGDKDPEAHNRRFGQSNTISDQRSVIEVGCDGNDALSGLANTRSDRRARH